MPVGPNGEPFPYEIPIPDDDGEAAAAPGPADVIEQMLDLADRYRRAERDAEDLLAMERARTLLQQLLAKQQKEADGLMQGKLSPGALRRAAGG